MRQALEPTDYPFFDYRRFTFSLGIAAAGSIWLSGSTAARFDPERKTMVVTGGLLEQAELIHRKMAATLVAADRTLGDVIRIVRYVMPAALTDLPRLDALQRQTFGPAVLIGTVVVHSLLRPEALIEIEAVANNGGEHAVEYLPPAFGIDSAAAWKSATAAIGARSDRILRIAEFTTPAVATDAGAPPLATPSLLKVVSPRQVDASSGVRLDVAIGRGEKPAVIYRAAEGDPAAGDVVEQCREVYERLGRLLEQAGASLDTVVKTTEFIPPAALAAYRKTGDIRREVFSAPYPAATGVLCESLSHRGSMIAVEAIAIAEPG